MRADARMVHTIAAAQRRLCSAPESSPEFGAINHDIGADIVVYVEAPRCTVRAQYTSMFFMYKDMRTCVSSTFKYHWIIRVYFNLLISVAEVTRYGIALERCIPLWSVFNSVLTRA